MWQPSESQEGRLPSVVVHTWSPSTWETEAGESRVRGQLELHHKTLTGEKEGKLELKNFMPRSLSFILKTTRQS
jgi:hypothetical protein